ncbi:hypothetical protein L227DRAFT_564155 [Lentinus tigrinus ALCF2SS1-6]|uniref:Uncharacterized protein n=1 Tax=Lentinus tigrinus ALCF2SS1-6 TaxID=1328759 RepID=A0A5C2S6T8_9APHY|nr:hypothetical protein L227DRAFT_564155 [Lentinus tigrinus ALCF2SS1-6]
MGNDELFSDGKDPDVPRNPLTIDDLKCHNDAVSALTLDEPKVHMFKLPKIVFVPHSREHAASPLIPDELAPQPRVPRSPLQAWDRLRLVAHSCAALECRPASSTLEPWLVSAHMNTSTFNLSSNLMPQLGVVNNMPFTILFDQQVGIFRWFMLSDMNARRRTHRVTIRGDAIPLHGFDWLDEVDMTAPIAITFIDSMGAGGVGLC